MIIPLLGGLAVISRYPALLLVAVPLILNFFESWKKSVPASLLQIIIFLVACLPELVWHSTAQNVVGNYQLNHWSILNWFKSSFSTNDGSQTYRFINIVYSTYPFWHPAYFAGGLILLPLVIKKGLAFKKVNYWLMLTIVIYLLFLAGIEFQNRRFFILVFPLIIILLLGLVDFSTISLRRLRWGVLAAIALNLGLSAYYIQPYYRMNRFEKQLAEDMVQYQNKRLYIFYWDLALQSYGLDFEYVNLWENEVGSLQNGDLVLFNDIDLQQQWAGSLLMKNWDSIRRTGRLKELENWDNWRLYEIE